MLSDVETFFPWERWHPCRRGRQINSGCRRSQVDAPFFPERLDKSRHGNKMAPILPEKQIMNPTITRRQFLGRSATALGSVLAAPAFVPVSVLGRNGTFAPSERITMGFIGVGTQGGGHLLGGAWTYVAGGYAGRKEVQVLAVCDILRERRERATRRVNDHYAEAYGQSSYKSCEAYNDFRE